MSEARNLVHCFPIGRFGNQLFQYAYARAWAERWDGELRCIPWVGEQIFELDDKRPILDLPHYTEQTIQEGQLGVVLSTYAQSQRAMIFTQEQVKSWFKLKPQWQELFDSVPVLECAGHRRVGDYFGYGYPVVSEASYYGAANGGNLPWPTMVTEEKPMQLAGLPNDLMFLADFWRLQKAKILLRGNSSFSWWASMLGEADTYAPVIAGLEGGKEHDCVFIHGNWPRFANLDFVTDLHPLKKFHEALRYDYPLNQRSIVVDAGAYEGQFSAELARRYGCHVYAYEPLPEFYDLAKKNLYDFPCVSVYNLGIGPKDEKRSFRVKGSMTGAYADDGEGQDVQLVSIAEVISNRTVDLLKLNVEGMEFEILEEMLRSDLVRHCLNIQVQFHPIFEGCKERYQAIRSGLLRTHRLTYDDPWVWENYTML